MSTAKFKATITPEEQKELTGLFARHEAFTEFVNKLSSGEIKPQNISDWIFTDCEKSIDRMKELNAKY